MTSPDPMLSKIRKLLTLAEDPAATPAEAEAFTAKATELITRYGIDQALLAQAPLAQNGGGRNAVADRLIRLAAPYARDKATLASGIARNLRCHAVLRSGTSDLSVHIFGLESDLACVEILLTSLLLQGTRDVTNTPVPWSEHPAAYRRSWWAGFSSAVCRRLLLAERASVREAERRTPKDGPSVALVLADHSDEAEAARDAAYPRLQTSARRRLSGGGSRDGYASGERADLNNATSVGRGHGREIAG